MRTYIHHRLSWRTSNCLHFELSWSTKNPKNTDVFSWREIMQRNTLHSFFIVCTCIPFAWISRIPARIQPFIVHSERTCWRRTDERCAFWIENILQLRFWMYGGKREKEVSCFKHKAMFTLFNRRCSRSYCKLYIKLRIKI